MSLKLPPIRGQGMAVHALKKRDIILSLRFFAPETISRGEMACPSAPRSRATEW